MYESMTKENYGRTYAFIAMMEGMIGLVAALYFSYISKNWFYLIFAGYIAQIIGVVGSFFIPESPLYLIKSGQIKEAQKVFASIAKVNGVDPDLVSPKRFQAIFGKDTSDTSLELKEYALKVGVIGVNTEAEAEIILEKAVASVVEIQAIDNEKIEFQGTSFELRACFEDREAFDEAL